MIPFNYILLIGTLLWASSHDIVKHRVPDYVFIVGGLATLIASIFSQGISSLFGMGKGLILLMFVGILIKIFHHFGMADVFALGLIGMTFPETRIGVLVSLIFIPMYIWMKFWSIITRKKKVPAIPGILLGTLALVIYTM